MEKTMKKLVLAATILCCIPINGMAAELELKQTIEGPDIETTQKWLKEKLENNGRDLYDEDSTYSNNTEKILYYNYDGCTARFKKLPASNGREIMCTTGRSCPEHVIDYSKSNEVIVGESSLTAKGCAVRSPDREIFINFSDTNLAAKISKAMNHLRKLCGAKDDPF